MSKKLILIYSLFLGITSCGGGGGDNNEAEVSKSRIVVSSCSPVTGDNTQNADGSTVVVRSHKNGSPIYKLATTRKLFNNTSVTMDYMLHEPVATPKGIIILIAGGGLTSRIEGTPGNQPTRSSGNFVVRSAHRYQAAGYRVITIDRPTDAENGAYGPSNVDIDKYRHSMQHAVDIATLLKSENAEGYNVIISGTSRGSISAAAMNTLASGIAMSSPLTSSPAGVPFSGYPVGSSSLPLTLIKRSSHILLHTKDTCAVTLPSDSRTLFSNLSSLGVNVVGNEVSGGFQNTVNNIPTNVCGGLDYHGYNGIENCAVTKETIWIDSLMTSLASNKTPIAASQTVILGNPIILTANDADAGDTLSYAVPYATTSLGGTVSTDAAGVVTYTEPVGVTGTSDSFAFTVTDGNGGVSTAVVSITLP